jgi:hypothetical protein
MKNISEKTDNTKVCFKMKWFLQRHSTFGENNFKKRSILKKDKPLQDLNKHKRPYC